MSGFSSPRSRYDRRPFAMSNRKGWRGMFMSGVQAARTASDVDALMKIAAGQAAQDFTPTHGWHFDEEGLGTGQANDFVGTAHLVSQGAQATRVSTGEYSGDRAATQVLNQAAGCWRTTDVNQCNFTNTAFAFALRMRFPVLGAGGWFLSKSDITANSGYFGIGATNGPALTMNCRSNDGVQTSNATATSTGYDDNAWRWVLAGRDITAAEVWVSSPLGEAVAAFLGTRNISNTNAGGYFGLWFNLFAGAIGGVTCDVSHMLCWEGAAARNVYLSRSTLRNTLATT